MKRWLAGALCAASSAVGLSLWLEPGATPPAPQAAPTLALAAKPLFAPPSAPAPRPLPTTSRDGPALLDSDRPGLNAREAQMLIQVMAEQGDPRSPPLGRLKPRQPASPSQRADPEQYSAFEDGQSRALIQAYTGGVQQIPAIRARIEQAAQAGERSAVEIDEARAALAQLEMLQEKLQREAPQLLP